MATATLAEYLTKGFALDPQKLRAVATVKDYLTAAGGGLGLFFGGAFGYARLPSMTPRSDPRTERLAEFVAYAKTLSGDEKGEAQVFLDRLFRGFGRGGYKEAGAVLEHRVKNDHGGTSFADLVWKPTVLIEMKKRGEDLAKHLQQATAYWQTLTPGRPRYVVLCNFDEFWVYDFEQSIYEPADKITLDDLPERYGPLAYLFPTNDKPVFGVDREKVTRFAADKLAAVYRRLKANKAIGPERAQRFVLQSLVCFFSEDIGLLPKHFFTTLLDECVDPPKAFDLFDGLFRAMNARGGTGGGRYKAVPYFNGGIFSESAAVELDPAYELVWLKEAARENWAHVSPDIFGTIFQHSMDAEERHAMGAHYTSQQDIMKIVGPTIIDPFTRALEKANTPKELVALRDRLTTLRVLDPACGSGNFLYIAYREMRRLEASIVAKESQVSKKQMSGQSAFAAVSPRQFYGMDVLPFAVELAKVTLSLAPKLSSDELHTTERTLPLDNLDGNIRKQDALINEDGTRSAWPAADVIIGNPPFLGAKRLKPEQGAEYVNKFRKAYDEVPGMADFCVYWFRRAHDHLPVCTPVDPFAGRAGLVGTQNIRNNQSRVGGLDHIVKSGTIVEAVENQPWSGEANVHVSIANWVKLPKGNVSEEKLLIPSPRRLWTKIEASLPLVDGESPESSTKVTTRGKRGKVRSDKSYELAARGVEEINSALSDTVDASGAKVLDCNTDPQRVFQGNTPGHDGFVLSAKDAKAIAAADKESAKVVYPYLIGREMISGDGKPERFIIDFEQSNLLRARSAAAAFAWVEKHVLPDIKGRAAKEAGDKSGESVRQDQLEKWWLHWRSRADRVTAAKKLHGRFIACSRVTKRPVFVFVSKAIRPGDALQTFGFDDDYSFGVLQSHAHWLWFVTKCSKLKSDFRYTPPSVYDTFPWPQSPTKKQIKAVAAAGRDVRAIRDKTLPTIKGGLRALYRTLELPGKNPLKDAHAALDAAVLEAYGFSDKKDLLKQLLDLNLAVAKAIDKGEDVTAPGVPKGYGDAGDLVTEDCIRP